MLLYKNDWLEAKGLFEAFWEGEINEPLLQVYAPHDEWPPYDGWDFCRHPDQPEIAIKSFENWCSKTIFGGLAYPNLWINFGPGILAAFLGSAPIFTEQTMWFGSQSQRGTLTLREITELEIGTANVWWNRVVKATRVAVETHAGKFVVGMTDIGGVLDIIASLRGTTEVLKDMYRDSSLLKAAISHVTEIWHECYETFHKIMRDGGHEGTSAWMGLWSPRTWYPLQCDISYMLSPAKFDEFVKPHLEEQCARLDHPVYHWDGPGQLVHARSLLELEFSAIQWVPGAREELSGNDCGSPKWFDVYKRVLSAGKALVLSLPPWRVKGFIKAFPNARVMIQTWVSSSDQARELLAIQKKTIS